jgi:Helix-turn-helix
VREVTRVEKSQTKRRDRAEVIIGNGVPDLWGRHEIECPLLQHGSRYVAFNGNGKRRGLGYLIVGKKNRGWLARCGYVHSLDNDPRWTGQNGLGHIARRFLAELEEIGRILGLTVVGLARTTESWLTLAQIQEIAEISSGLKELNQIHLRIYGPEDYLDQCRCVLEERGGFSTIPGAQESPYSLDADALLADVGVDLRVRLRRSGLSQNDLAERLGVSKSFVSKLLSGKKAWPEGLRERAETIVAGDAPNLPAR